MNRHLIVGLFTAFLCFGCATDPGPKPTFQDGTRVGILNILESYMTHRHITIDRINSFTKQIKVDWNMPAYLNNQIADSLKKDKRFVVVPIRSSQIKSRLKQLTNQIREAAIRRKMSQDLAGFIEETAKSRDLDFIIVVQSFRGETPWKIHDDPIVLEGYGLFTRRTLLGAVGIKNSWAHPYAQIQVVVFQTRPAARIGAGRPKEKLGLRIQAYADPAVKNALQDAHMISPE